MSEDAPHPPHRPAPAPSDLAGDGRKPGAGRRLWKSITSKYELRPDELRILHAACRCDDVIEELGRLRGQYEAHDRYKELLVRGSQGQSVENPLRARVAKITEDIMRQDATLTAHLAKLKLPDENPTAEEGSTPRSVSARSAANSRWGKTG